jgi:polysaccharide biosynthesis transport protein
MIHYSSPERQPGRQGLLPGAQIQIVEPPRGGILGLGLREVLKILRVRWWLVLGATAACFGAAWFLIPKSTVEYNASSVVRLADARRELTGNLEGVGLPENVQRPDFMTSQLHVLRSRVVAGTVVDRVGLRLVPDRTLSQSRLTAVAVAPDAGADSLWFRFTEQGYTVRSRDGEARAAYGQPVQLGGVSLAVGARPVEEEATARLVSRDDAINRLLDGLGTNARERSTIIDITYVDADPLRAQLVVNAVAEAFSEQNVGRVREQAVRRREFVADRLLQAENRLEEAETALSQFRSESRLFSSRDRLLAEQASLMELDIRREELDADRRMANTLLARMEAARDVAFTQELQTLVSYPGIASNTVISQLYAQLSQHQGERQRLLAEGRSESHPEVVRSASLVGSTRAELVNAVRSHVSSLDARLAALDGLRARTASTIGSLPEAETQETRLTQDLASARRMADVLREELQRAEMAEAVEVGHVEILDLASFATPRTGGRRVQKLMLALAFGLLLGSGGALLLESTNSSIRRRDELESVLAVPGLAVIPQIGSEAPGRGSWSLPRRGERLSLGTGGNGTRRLAATELQSPGAEAYRQLRTSLYYSQPTERLRTLVVSSAAAGEGKTTTVANLAVTFARQGMRVLLIDADLRRPRLHHVFNVVRDPGLTDVLLGRVEPAEAVHDTQIERLAIVPRGPFEVEAIETLSSDRTREVLDYYAERYDVVLLDTPPVLVAADAAVLGAVAEGVLLVVRAGQTSRDEARQALNQLSAVGARVVGSVLNDIDATAARYGESYHYYYRSYAATE